MGGLVTKGDQTDPAPRRIIYLTKPSEDEIDRILGLKELCEQRQGNNILLGSDFLHSLDKAGVGALELLKGGRIIGFAFFYSFVKEVAEGMVFADPDEDWSNTCSLMLNATLAECERRGHNRLLLMNDRRFAAGAEFLIVAGGKLTFSEHRMEATGDRSIPSHHVDLGEVGNDDTRLLGVELACFGVYHSKPDQRRYLASIEGRPVGKVDVNVEGTIIELTGLCVVPELRGMGHGKAILLEIIDVLKVESQERIVLDVQTDNDIALELYQKVGFRKAFTIDYYEIALGRISSGAQNLN